MKTSNNIYKSYKIKLYPTKQQEELFIKHSNAARYVWNLMLAHELNEYHTNGGFIRNNDLYKLLTEEKRKPGNQWLYEVSNITLQRVCTNLYEAYRRYFENNNGHPKFKSVKTEPIHFPVRANQIYFTADNRVNIEKIGQVKYKSDMPIIIGKGAMKVYNTAIKKVGDKYILYVAVGENQAGVEHNSSVNIDNQKRMGIDVGLKHLAIVAMDGKDPVFYKNINKTYHIKRLEKREHFYERRVSRKREAYAKELGHRKYDVKDWLNRPKNLVKEIEKVSRLRRKQANIRENYINHIVKDIIEMKPDRIVTEDLFVEGLKKNRHLSKHVSKAMWRTFFDKLKYKCEVNGIEYKKVPRFYPSSKTCSCCGYIKKDLRLSDRVYICPECGYEEDRDVNAANNLKNYIFE